MALEPLDPALWFKPDLDPDRPPPRMPQPGECCERGCDPCVWDWYREALKSWKADHPDQEPHQDQEPHSDAPR